MVDFFAIARGCLQPLADRGFTFWDEKLCRCDRLECNRGDLEIRVSYEAYGPPWCDIYEARRFVRRIEVESEFTTSEVLARMSLERFRAMQSGPPSVRTLVGMPQPSSGEVALLGKHAQELEVWCNRLLKTLEDEKTIAEPSAAPNGGPATRPGISGATDGPPSVS